MERRALPPVGGVDACRGLCVRRIGENSKLQQSRRGVMGTRTEIGDYGTALLRLFAPLFSRRQVCAPPGFEDGGGTPNGCRGSRPGSGDRATRRIPNNGARQYCALAKCRRRIDRSHELLSGHYGSEARRKGVAARREPLAAGAWWLYWRWP